MTSLADDVLPLIRSRAELWRWNAANQHGEQMHGAIDRLEAALPMADPADAYAVAHRALASAVKVIARADDSSDIIGDACRRLLDLHPQLAAAASVSPKKLVDWMLKFQFEGDVDYFDLDPIAYAPALGEQGMALYPERLDELRERFGPALDTVVACDAVQFARSTLKDLELAWRLAHSPGLADAATWRELGKAYERVDPLAVLPVYRELVDAELVEARAQQYGFAARRLARMRRIAAGTDEADAVARFIAELRERYYRRPRLQQEFDRAGLT